MQVIAIDARNEGLSLAKECGANTIIDAREGKEKVVEAVRKVTGGQGADATLNVSDRESEALRSRNFLFLVVLGVMRPCHE